MNPYDAKPPARYVPFFVTFLLLACGLLFSASRRERREADPLELLEGCLAAFYTTEVIARERVGSLIREPVVEPKPDADPYDMLGSAKQPTGSGVRRTAGELVTCTRCLGPWVGLAYTAGRTLAPRQTRIMTRVFALAGANSMLHAVHAHACARTNVTQVELSRYGD